MKFKQNSRRKALQYEKDLVKYWKKHQTFQKSIDQRPTSNAYVFYDGPPFITGVPHHGTLLSSIVKDAVPRYQTMKGKRVERVWGWDCHGLPAEVFTEKKLGITDRRDIGTKISLQEYISTCRDNMVQTGGLWEDTIDRIGRWVDFKGAYKTMDKDYMESVWWAFKKLYDDGKIYEGEKVLLYCTRDATPISKAEVAMDNSYQDVTDPSVFVKFKLLHDGEQDAARYLLAWTTTPWTLSANMALAINQDATYAEVQVGSETFIVAEALVKKVFTDEKHQPLEHTIVRTFKGKELAGKSYIPLDMSDNNICIDEYNDNEHKIWHGDFVGTEEGTGIVHIAPAFGEDDYQLAKKHQIPLAMTVDDSGQYTAGEWQGHQVWEVNKQIAKTLHERGVVFKIDYIRHSYPHCHRCGTKLMYRAHPSWFMDIAGQREQMLEHNGDINWFPAHLKNGRFAKTIQSAPDWNLSRDRFWATAMPVWKGTDKNGKVHTKVIGSYAELKELSGIGLEDYHRPWVDDITFEANGVTYHRIDKVLDCWFESGSMPFAQFHYPFENVEKFEANFPGDFIVEYVGQVRAWFYYVHAVGVGLFGEHSFKNVITTGTLAGNDGRKMSKSFGNYTDPNELMDQYSADALRFLLLSSPLLNAEDFSLQDKDVADVNRKLAMIWNMYDFFTLYADVDKWEWNGDLADPSDQLTNPLDQWVVSRVHQLSQEVDKHMQAYDLQSALAPILPFIDDASNWYVRRSRRRFWKSGDDTDKNQAYQTLHYMLVRLSMIMAPFTPFLAEELYQKLTGGESVHLLDWPEGGHVNQIALDSMEAVREAINLGLSQRAEQKVKVRQPLASAHIQATIAHPGLYTDIIAEELNVKEAVITPVKQSPGPQGGSKARVTVKINFDISEELKIEGIMRELIRHIQNLRKTSGLQVDDRITLHITSEDPLITKAVQAHQATILQETLATLHLQPQAHHAQPTIDGAQAAISLQKAA